MNDDEFNKSLENSGSRVLSDEKVYMMKLSIIHNLRLNLILKTV